MSGHIFVSYARMDLAYVQRLVSYLAQAGVSVWVDEEIPTGDRWERVLIEKIETCAGLLVVMSPAAADSMWVAREVRYAQELGKPVLPLLLEGKPILGLHRVQFEDVRDGAMPSPAFVQRLRGATPQRGIVRHLIGTVPDRADCFQHRAVAQRFEQALASAGTTILTGAPTQILSGLGGVGKTQLAAAVARSLLEQGGLHLLMWVSAASQDAIITGYAQASAAVTGADPSVPQAAAKALLAWLATTTSRWLVVLDDLVNPRDLDGWWPPTTATGRVVVTTRRQDAALASHGTLIPIGVFTRTESLAYLAAKLADHPGRLAQAGELAHDLGDLPVALAQAAAYIVDRDITCADYRKRFADRQHSLLELTPDVFPDGYVRPVATTLSLSVEVANQLAPAGLARPLLTVLALLDPNGVPVELLITPTMLGHLAAHRGPEPADAERARDALGCLARLNLASTSDEGGWRLARVHALVQRATRDQTPTNLIEAAVDAAAQSLLECWPEVERHRGVGQSLRANTQALRDHGEARLWHPNAHVLLFRAGQSLGEAGLAADAADHFQQLATKAAVRLGPDHPDTLTGRHELARWRGEAGDPTGAVSAFGALLPDRLRVLGPDHPDTLATRHHLARWRGEAGDPTGAVSAFGALLPDRLRVLGPDHPDTLATRQELARWRGEAGDPTGAVAAFEVLLADYQRVLGPDHPDTLASGHNLAYWRGKAGDPGGAASALEVLLADYQRVLGSDHPQTLSTRANLAYSRGRAGDPAGAASAFEVLLAHRLRVLGPDHPDTLITRANLASWRGEAGGPTEAVAAFEALLADYLRVVGPDHPHTLATRHHLASWRGKAGNPAGAVRAFEALLTDRLRVLGADHPDTLATQHDLAYWRAQART